MILNVSIPEKAKPWKRPANNRYGGRYNPSKSHQKEIGWWVKEQMIRCGYVTDDAVSKFSVFLLFYGVTRGDIDNLIKNVLDACSGVVWRNDRQVEEVQARLIPDSKSMTKIIIKDIAHR